MSMFVPIPGTSDFGQHGWHATLAVPNVRFPGHHVLHDQRPVVRRSGRGSSVLRQSRLHYPRESSRPGRAQNLLLVRDQRTPRRQVRQGREERREQVLAAWREEGVRVPGDGQRGNHELRCFDHVEQPRVHDFCAAVAAVCDWNWWNALYST